MTLEVNIQAAGRQLTLCGTKETYLEGLKGWNADSGPIFVATKDLPHGSLCFDVGANIGATAVTLAAQRPDLHIIAFEPIPDNAEANPWSWSSLTPGACSCTPIIQSSSLVLYGRVLIFLEFIIWMRFRRFQLRISESPTKISCTMIV
jgi:hypothetical protein